MGGRSGFRLSQLVSWTEQPELGLKRAIQPDKPTPQNREQQQREMAKYARPRAAPRRTALTSAFLEEQEDDEMELGEGDETDDEADLGGYRSEGEGRDRGRRVMGEEEEVGCRLVVVGGVGGRGGIA